MRWATRLVMLLLAFPASAETFCLPLDSYPGVF